MPHSIEPPYNHAEAMYVQTVDTFTLLIGMGFLCVVAALAAAWALGRRSVALRDPIHSNTRSLAQLFHERVTHFESQVRTLDDHADDYVTVFRGDDWNTLTETIKRLHEIDAQVQTHIASQDFPQAQSLLGGLYGTEGVSQPLEPSSAGWEDSVRRMLKSVVHNLEAATNETKRLSEPTKPRRRRQPTLLTLADIKKALIEDKIIKRGG